MYKEEDFLMLSGIQHFEFCKRQWALIHIENQWSDNYRTEDGKIMHERVHDDEFTEKRGKKIIVRGMPVKSRNMGINGVCDVVEFVEDNEFGISIFGWESSYCVVPVEYKRGKAKAGKEDKLQLAAQAICLEEMLLCEIPFGYIYYGQTRTREKIEFNSEIKNEVRDKFEEMHRYYERKYTPRVRRRKSCNSCSLKDICLPSLENRETVESYINRYLKYEETK